MSSEGMSQSFASKDIPDVTTYAAAPLVTRTIPDDEETPGCADPLVSVVSPLAKIDEESVPALEITTAPERPLLRPDSTLTLPPLFEDSPPIN
jgi:hypothetical protein